MEKLDPELDKGALADDLGPEVKLELEHDEKALSEDFDSEVELEVDQTPAELLDDDGGAGHPCEARQTLAGQLEEHHADVHPHGSKEMRMGMTLKKTFEDLMKTKIKKHLNVEKLEPKVLVLQVLVDSVESGVEEDLDAIGHL